MQHLEGVSTATVLSVHSVEPLAAVMGSLHSKCNKVKDNYVKKNQRDKEEGLKVRDQLFSLEFIFLNTNLPLPSPSLLCRLFPPSTGDDLDKGHAGPSIMTGGVR